MSALAALASRVQYMLALELSNYLLDELASNQTDALEIGDAVQCNYLDRGTWCSGIVIAKHSKDCFDVALNNGGMELKVPGSRVRPAVGRLTQATWAK